MPYYPVQPQLSPKELEKRGLKKTANKLGFFVLVYFAVMVQLVSIISFLLRAGVTVTEESVSVFTYLMQIIASVGSALAAALFYKLISRQRLSDNLSKSHVPMSTLIPMVLLGMGVAMLATQMAALFDSNISLFQLKNQAEMTDNSSSVPEIILFVVSTAIVPALAEELTFRGIFMGVMRKYGDAVAIITSAALFGAMHGNTTQIIFAFVLGLIFAYVDCKANSIVPSIIIHFVNNFYAVAADILTSSAGLDKHTVTLIHTFLIIMFCALGVLSYIYFANRDKSFFRISDGDANGIAHKSCLTLKEKITAVFTSAGVIVSLSFFIAEMILNLIPQEVQAKLLRSISGG